MIKTLYLPKTDKQNLTLKAEEFCKFLVLGELKSQSTLDATLQNPGDKDTKNILCISTEGWSNTRE